MAPTVYIEITAEGGRIGRFEWWNGDQQLWGHTRWDRYWPAPRPIATPFWAHVADAVEKLASSFQALVPTLAAARVAMEKLGAHLPPLEGREE